MATPPRSAEMLEQIADAYRDANGNKREAAQLLGMNENTFYNAFRDAQQRGYIDDGSAKKAKKANKPPVPPVGEPFILDETGEPVSDGLPDPIRMSYDPLQIDDVGTWGIISDVHLPYHDLNTIRKWADECKRRNVVGLVLNGDILDCYQLSSHYKDPTKARFRQELDAGKSFLKWLRQQFPKARIVYKEGNHDDRLRRYIAERAPALFDVQELDLRVLLGLDDLGVEWIADKRVIELGKLSVVHGHEFRGGGGVNPARWLYLRTGASALCGHFHRSSEHHETTLDRRQVGVWSVGCACYLYPEYDPNNKWNHGYALVELSQNGHYSVTNRKILRDGSVV